MSSTKIVIFLVVLCITSAFGGIGIGSLNDPKNPGKCTISANLILSPGDEIKDPDADCGSIRCDSNGIATFKICTPTAVVGCKTGDYKNKSLPFPECCSRHIICD